MDPSTIKAETLAAQALVQHDPLTVPRFQRPYVWGKDQWEQLWVDVVEAEDESAHFLGNLVTCRDESGHVLLVDGQQRMTTLFILATVLRNELWDRGLYEDAEEIQRSFLMRRSPKKGNLPNLVLDGADGSWMRAFVYADLPARDTADGFPTPPKRGAHEDPSSVKNKNKAYWFFRGKARELAQKDEGLLVQAPYRVMRDALFVTISLQSDADAYALFERLNSTGLQLSLADLLNNFVLSRIEDGMLTDPVKAKQDWDSAIEVVGYDHLDDYVRRQWLSRRSKITKRTLYKKIASEVRAGKTDLQVFLHDLADEAPAYVDLTRKSGQTVPGSTPILQEMKDLNLVLGQTLLLPVWASALTNREKLRYLDIVDTFLVRWAPIHGQVTNVLEDEFSAWARRFREAPVSAFPEIEKSMLELGPTDDQVWQSFRVNDFKPKTATAILRRIGLEFGMDWGSLMSLKALPLFRADELREGRLACFLEVDELLDDTEKIGAYVLVRLEDEKEFLHSTSYRARFQIAEKAAFPALRPLRSSTEFGPSEVDLLARTYEEHARRIWSFEAGRVVDQTLSMA